MNDDAAWEGLTQQEATAADTPTEKARLIDTADVQTHTNTLMCDLASRAEAQIQYRSFPDIETSHLDKNRSTSAAGLYWGTAGKLEPNKTVPRRNLVLFGERLAWDPERTSSEAPTGVQRFCVYSQQIICKDP